METALFLAGIAPVASETDPFAGFSSRFPLFIPQTTSSENPNLVTADNRLALFNRQSFSAKKPADGCRIFCLGGSTTYGRPYDDQTSFSGFLRAALSKLDPDRQWEVVNAGGISYGSVRIALLLRELVNYEPDVFVIYTGHNEFLEDLTYASLIQTHESVRTLGGWLAHSRTFSLAHRIATSNSRTRTTDSTALPDEVDAILDRSIGPGAYRRDEVWYREVAAQFRQSLELIIRMAEASGAKVILVTPASSLRDCEPFKSEHDDGLTGEQLRTFTQYLKSATQAFDNHEEKLALDHVTQALKIDARYAAAWYLLGRILLSTGDEDGAKRAFQRALEEDVCPLRARNQIVEIVRETAGRRRLPLVDFSEQMVEVSEHGIPGSDWFLDHVHPTIAGHRLLAKLLCDALVDSKIARPQPAWTDQSFDDVANQVQSQIDPVKHAVALRNLAKVLSWAGKTDDSDRLAQMAIEQLPGDSEAQSMAGFAALRRNDLSAARTHFEAALRVAPQNVKALDGLGNVFSLNGEPTKARDCFARAVRINSSSVPSWFNLGNACRELNQLDDAAAAYGKSLSLEPKQPDVHKNLGLVRIAQGNLPAAVKEFEAALHLQPDSPERHAELGFLLIDSGRNAHASKKFEDALSIDPNCISGLIGTALVLEQQGNVADAATVIRRAIAIAPENRSLRDLLDRLTR
tara:strand:+ start:396507 stop:398573 length:2067 start_codon:yes stop_codon:yes gene_type:complete